MYLELDSPYRIVRCGGRQVHFSEVEFKVLQRLLDAKRGPVSKPEFMAAMYGEEAERETKIVDIFLMRVRRKLEKLTGRDDVILNFRGRGWALQAERR